MAEAVQKFIETTIPELKDLQKRKIFSENEIKQIIKKRTDFEYAVRRRGAKKIDFLRYIEYEQALEKLRVKRKKRLNIATKSSSPSEHSIIQRVHHIFDRATRKFTGDVELWMEYLRFAKLSKSTKKLAKIFVRALKFHPRCPELWVAAAAYEWEDNGSSVASRNLFQQALRLNDDSELLWKEYFKMELLFISKLLERKKVLLIESALAKDDTADEADRLLKSGAIAKIVYQNAREKVKSENVVQQFQMIVDEIKETYETMAETCDLLTKFISEK